MSPQCVAFRPIVRQQKSQLFSTPQHQQEWGTYSARFLDDNGLEIITDEEGRTTARPSEETKKKETTTNNISIMNGIKKQELKEHPVNMVPSSSGFNVVLTHCTSDFDSLASAVGLAKLWSSGVKDDDDSFDSASNLPTFVVLPRGAHPGVQRFLALHKHLFPIRSLRSLPPSENLNRLGLVDAQRRDRIGPAESLLKHANRVTIVDHHVDSESDILNRREGETYVSDYIVDNVGSVSTLMVERIIRQNLELTQAEATLLALGIHADTGSLKYDSATPRDAYALAHAMECGASQAAIAEHAQASLSHEQQGVLTQALTNSNVTLVHGVTVSTVLLRADGFINGLAAVTQDALELSSSDVFLLGLVYQAKSGSGRSKNKNQEEHKLLKSRLFTKSNHNNNIQAENFAQAWMGGDEALLRQRLRAAFDRADLDLSGSLEIGEISNVLGNAGVVLTQQALKKAMETMDQDGDGKVDFEEFVAFAKEHQQHASQKKACTMIVIGRVRAGANLKHVKLNKLLEQFGGGGHPKAASATLRLDDEDNAETVIQELVDELISTGVQQQPVVANFMTSPVLSVKADMTEKQVEDLFIRHDVRGLPVVDEDQNVIGLVTYKEVAAAKQRLWNKEQKRQRQLRENNNDNKKKKKHVVDEKVAKERKAGSTVKGWMKQHIHTVQASATMAEVEAVLLETNVGCIPVVKDGTRQLIGMVTRTDLLRQHRYYSSLHYHNKGFSDSIAARKPIIELRKRLKKFDVENE